MEGQESLFPPDFCPEGHRQLAREAYQQKEEQRKAEQMALLHEICKEIYALYKQSVLKSVFEFEIKQLDPSYRQMLDSALYAAFPGKVFSVGDLDTPRPLPIDFCLPRSNRYRIIFH